MHNEHVMIRLMIINSQISISKSILIEPLFSTLNTEPSAYNWLLHPKKGLKYLSEDSIIPNCNTKFFLKRPLVSNLNFKLRPNLFKK